MNVLERAAARSSWSCACSGVEVAVDVEDPPEVLERAVRVPERVALEVEEEVAGRGVGQEREAGFRLRLQQPVDVVAGLARVQLQLGLLAVLGPRVGVDPGRHGLCGRAAELRERRDPGGRELLDLRPVDAGDAGEVVDLVPARVADGLEVADVAVVDRVRLGRRRVGDELLEPRADAPVVGGELARVEARLLAVAEQDVDLLRLAGPGSARAARCRRGAGGCRRAWRERASLVSSAS